MSAWLRAAQRLREERTPAALVTVTAVRGHAPREAGAKMVVAADGTWGSIGGGNLEERAVRAARRLLAGGVREPLVETVGLTDRAPVEHGVQCCGGEVTYLVEPLPVPPAVAVFGVGHVGLELALLLSRHDLDLHLVDSRADQLAAGRLAPVTAGEAAVRVHAVPVLPELVLADLPRGCHLLVMTHDHAEDLAVLDAALRTEAGWWGSVGVIGSAAKWVRFRRALLEAGLPADAVDAVRSPIGDGGARDRTPAAIALAVAADLLGAGAGRPVPGR